MSLLVKIEVARPRVHCIAFGRDCVVCLLRRDEVSQRLGPVRFVRQDIDALQRDSTEQRCSHFTIVHLAATQTETQRVAKAVDNGVDLSS